MWPQYQNDSNMKFTNILSLWVATVLKRQKRTFSKNNADFIQDFFEEQMTKETLAVTQNNSTSFRFRIFLEHLANSLLSPSGYLAGDTKAAYNIFFASRLYKIISSFANLYSLDCFKLSIRQIRTNNIPLTVLVDLHFS
ncbi:hypothetical protein Bca4012_074544 [Brassica carinata]